MSDIITSRSNPKIKFARKMRDRKVRDEFNVFFIEGARIVGEAYARNWRIREVFYSPELIKTDFSTELIETFRAQNLSLVEVDKEVFKTISIKDGPKGLAAIVEKRFFPAEDVLKGGIWIALDRIQDPGNLGTIIRTADAVAQGILLIDDCTDPFDLSAVRSSMGALFSVKIINLTSQEFTKMVEDRQLFLVGTSDSGSIDFRLEKYQKDMILLMGSEREGLTRELTSACSSVVRIPMAGKSDSLNLAVASGVCLYEIYNQMNPVK
jgi:TrmH family RNA methyltransferase